MPGKRGLPGAGSPGTDGSDGAPGEKGERGEPGTTVKVVRELVAIKERSYFFGDNNATVVLVKGGWSGRNKQRWWLFYLDTRGVE